MNLIVSYICICVLGSLGYGIKNSYMHVWQWKGSRAPYYLFMQVRDRLGFGFFIGLFCVLMVFLLQDPPDSAHGALIKELWEHTAVALRQVSY